jgi:hypothetical protein
MADAPSVSSLLSEKLISFAQAARLIPPSRQSRPVSPSCIWRWYRSGVTTADGRTIKLEAIWLVNRLVTSEEAMKRFIAAQQPQTQPATEPDKPTIVPARSRSPERQRRESERALRELQNLRK